MEQRPASAFRSAIPPPPPPPPPPPSSRQRIFTFADTPKPSAVRAPQPPFAPTKPSVRRFAGPPSALPKPPVRPPPAQPEDPSTAARASPAPPPTLSGLHADLARLLETKEGADVEFEVRGVAFAAHKLVLAARSPVFRADFFGAAKERPTSYIRICDMHPDAFAAMLHHIYTDRLPETVTTTTAKSARGEEAAVLAQDLLVAADRYKLKDLKSVTEETLCNSHVGVSTVLPMLALAEHHQCWKLKKSCLEFMASSRNTRAIVANNNDDLEHLARNCPSVVKDVLTKILDSREASPSNPLVVSIDDSFYVNALIAISAIAFWGMIIFCSFAKIAR